MFQNNPLSVDLLNSLPVRAYCYPRLFQTSFDTEEHNREQYRKGLEIGSTSLYVSISVYGGFWSIVENEIKIGFTHFGIEKGSAALLAGLIASGCELRIFGRNRETFTVLNDFNDYKIAYEYALD
jgi:hypothetical protein